MTANKMNINQPNYYIFHSDNDIKEISDPNECNPMSLKDFLQISFNDIKLMQYNLDTSEYYSKINSFDQKIHQKRLSSKFTNLNIQDQFSKIPFYTTNIKYNIEYMEKRFSKTFAKKPNEYLNNFEKLFNDKEQKIDCENIKEVIEDLEYVNKSFNNFINFINGVDSFQYKIARYLVNLTEIIKNKKISNSSQFLIDSNLNPIIACNKKQDKDAETKNNQIAQVFHDICKQYEQLFCENFSFLKNESNQLAETPDKSEYDIEDYFKKEINEFYVNLSKIDPKNETNENILFQLKNILSKLNISKEITTESAGKNDKYFINILEVADFHAPQNVETIQKSLNSMFEVLESFQDDSMKQEIYDETRRFLKDKFNFKSDSNEDLVDEIMKNGKYFYLDIFFQIFLEHIIKTQTFERISTVESKEEDEFKRIDLKSISLQNFNAEKSTSFGLLYDDQTCFYLQKEFFGEINEKQRDREIDILSQNYSKFIVHIVKKMPEKKYIIPYFPNGTLKSIFFRSEKTQNIFKLSNVDKIVIILEICTAFEDLYLNKQYHGNLSSSSVLINAAKDAYLGNFYSDDLDKNSTINRGISYIDYQTLQKDKPTNLEMDIYFFGVLLFEIISEVSPDILLKNKAEKEQYLKDYFNFLFSSTNEANYNEFLIDSRGDSMIGMKNIIEKCMNKDLKSRYSSFSEIRRSVMALAIYEGNKEEIDYRIEKAVHSKEYNCTAFDFAESYYRGQNTCKEIIEEFITKQSQEEKEEKSSLISKVLAYFYNDNNVDNIDDVKFDNNLTTEIYLSYLLHIVFEKSQKNIKDVVHIINSIFFINRQYIDSSSTSNFYSKFLKEIDDTDFTQNNQSISLFKQTITQIFKKGKYYYFDVLVHCLLEQILDKKNFITAFQDLYEKNHKKPNPKIYIQQINRFGEVNSSYRVYFDQSMNFYLQKNYKHQVRKYYKDREKRIMTANYSKYITSIIEKESDANDDSMIVIPYYPLGMLENLFDEEVKIKFTLIDKIVMILEIATAMNDLHQNNEYHGSLSGEAIFIDSCKNAYLTAFCYDIAAEIDATTPIGAFYFRSPERMKEVDEQKEKKIYNKTDNIEVDDNDKIKKLQSDDIYSFGILIHSIITEMNPRKRMDKENYARQKRVDTIAGNYFEFLFKDANNEIFGNSSLKGLKDIIEKCMKLNRGERFLSFKELIESIESLQIYKENKEEIEYRLNHAKESAGYRCSLNDIVESYCRGQQSCKTDIATFLSEYCKILKQDSEFMIEIEDDIIKQMLETCDIMPKEDKSVMFHQIFNVIIMEYFKQLYQPTKICDQSDQLFLLSIQKNTNYINSSDQNIIYNLQNIDFIIPICTLEDFITKNKEKCKNYSLIWAYLIAKELNMIHTYDLYCGNLNTKMIGIYYNNETDSLSASLILYYFLYKINQQSENLNSKKQEENWYSNDEIICKYQRKDINKFIKIAQELGIDDEIIISLKKHQSMNLICFYLYNRLRKIPNLEVDKLDSIKNYFSFQVTYPRMTKIHKLIQENKYSLEEFCKSSMNSLLAIKTFVEKELIDITSPMIDNLLFVENDEQQELEQIIKEINLSCGLLVEKYNEQMQNQTNDDSNQEKRIINPIVFVPFTLQYFTDERMEERTSKLDNLLAKPVYANLEYVALKKISFKSLFMRFLMSLNPKFKYRVKIIFNTPKVAQINCEEITIQDVQSIANVIKCLSGEIYELESKNGYYFYLNRSEK